MSFRDKKQEQAYDAMRANHEGKPFLGQFPTGLGKTYLAYLYASEQAGNTIIALPTNNLITQTMEKLKDYPWLDLKPEQVKRFYPMSAYPSPSKCADKGVIYEEGEYVDDIITRLKEERPNLMHHEIALDSSCPKEEKREYEARKDDLMGAKVILTTHHAIMNDAWTNGRYLKFDYQHVIVDEADQIHGMAKLRFNRAITPLELQKLSLDKELNLGTLEGLQELLNACEKALPHTADKQQVLELIATTKVIMHHLNKEPSYYNYGQEANGDWRIYFKNPAKIIARLYEDKQFYFLSGTLTLRNKLDDFGRLIAPYQQRTYSSHSSIIEHEDFGRLNFIFGARIDYDERVSFTENRRNDPNHPSYLNKPLTVACIAQALQSCGHTLVLTASADDTLDLAQAFPEAVFQKRGENLKHAIARLKSSTAATKLLIAHGAWAGLDLGDIEFKSLVIPRIPYAYPSDVELEPFQDAQMWVIRKLAQGLGRVLRAAHHEAFVFLLDRRFPWSNRMCKAFGKTNVNSATHEALNLAIPTRFHHMPHQDVSGYNHGAWVEMVDGQLVIHWFKGRQLF